MCAQDLKFAAKTIRMMDATAINRGTSAWLSLDALGATTTLSASKPRLPATRTPRRGAAGKAGASGRETRESANRRRSDSISGCPFKK